MQEVVLREAGYEFELINLSEADVLPALIRDLKRLNPKASYPRLIGGFRLACEKGLAIDRVQDFVRLNAGFAADASAFPAAERAALRAIDEAGSIGAVRAAGRDALARMNAIVLEKPERPLRVGIVGEFYMVCEPFASFGVERQLVARGIEVHRVVTISSLLDDWFHGARHMRELVALGAPYIENPIGSHGTESVGMTNKMMKQGFDGVVHLKPFGCMPEVNAASVLRRLSREHTFPVLCLSYDAQTSETGVATRIEAFCDILEARRSRAD